MRIRWFVLCFVMVAACSKTPTSPSTSPVVDPGPATPAPAAAAALAAISLSQTSIAGDGTVTGTVALTTGAPAGGATVALASNNAAASVPASITVPAGSVSQTFAVKTFTPSASRTVTLTASYAGVVKTVDLLVQTVAAPAPSGSSPTGRWAGRFTCAAPNCAGAFAFADIQLNVVQGSSATGTCAYSDGRSGSFTLSAGATKWNANPVNLVGGCISGTLDVIYNPDADDWFGWFKADYSGAMTRR